MKEKKLLFILSSALLLSACSANANNQTNQQNELAKEERVNPDDKPFPVNLACCEEPGLVVTVNEMAKEEFYNIEADKSMKERYLVIDLRDEAAYQKGHTKYAINMPSKTFEERLGRIRDMANAYIILYANTLEESKKAGEFLKNNQFSRLFVMDFNQIDTEKLVTFNNLTGSEFQKLIDKNEGLFIDARDKKDYDKKHQKDAILVDYQNLNELNSQVPQDKTAKINIYDYTGDRSLIIAEQLQALGYENITISIDGTKENKFYF